MTGIQATIYTYMGGDSRRHKEIDLSWEEDVESEGFSTIQDKHLYLNREEYNRIKEIGNKLGW